MLIRALGSLDQKGMHAVPTNYPVTRDRQRHSVNRTYPSEPLGFAHRGAPGRGVRENTLPAFRAALQAGVPGLESDVWLTADNVPVLLHDGYLRRVEGQPSGTRRVPAGSAGRGGACRHGNGVPGCGGRGCGGAGFGRCPVRPCRPGSPRSKTSTPSAAPPSSSASTSRTPQQPPSSSRLPAPRARLRRAGCGCVAASTRCRPGAGRSATSPTWSTRCAGEMCRRASRPAPGRCTSAGIDVLNMHRTDWRPAAVGAVREAGCLAFGWDVQTPAALDVLLGMGCAGVYSDSVPQLLGALARRRDRRTS